MKKSEAPELTAEQEFEAPEVTEIGSAADVILGIPVSGWDYHGMSEPTFEFESDEE